MGLLQCGEYNITSSNATDNIVQLIRTQEQGYGNTTNVYFQLRKFGILVYAACSVVINGRTFTLDANETLEFDTDDFHIMTLVFITTGVKAKIRYGW